MTKCQSGYFKSEGGCKNPPTFTLTHAYGGSAPVAVCDRCKEIWQKGREPWQWYEDPIKQKEEV